MRNSKSAPPAVDHITFGRLWGHYESKSSPLNFPSAYSHDQ